LTVNGLLQGIPGTPNGQGTNVLFGVLHNTHGFLGFLQALRNEGVSKDLAQPSLTTMSGTPASFLVGGQQAIPQPGGLGTISITYQEFGTKLNFLPIVLGNGKIHLEIEPEVSSIDNTLGTSIQGTVVPGFATTRTHATVELETGQTFVMAGFVDHSVQATTNKVPVLGDLPFIGAAFSSKSYTEIEQEMVILVTPHLVDAQDCSQLTKCLPGQESRSPSDFELFLEGILEAPRGPRQVFQNHHYVPAFKNGPTNELFPCAGGRGGAGCATGSCGTAAGCGATAAPVQTAVPARTMAAPAAAQIVPASAVEPMTIHVVPAPASTPRNVDPESLIPALPPDNEN
jgi:pilus assembly protein CpaC